MKTIKLTEVQYYKLFENIGALKGDDQSDVIDYVGPSQGMSMITTAVNNSDGDIEYGKPMNTGSDKFAKEKAPQTPFSSRRSGLAVP